MEPIELQEYIEPSEPSAELDALHAILAELQSLRADMTTLQASTNDALADLLQEQAIYHGYQEARMETLYLPRGDLHVRREVSMGDLLIILLLFLVLVQRLATDLWHRLREVVG